MNCTKENPSEKNAMKLMTLIDELFHRMYKILGIQKVMQKYVMHARCTKLIVKADKARQRRKKIREI